MRGRTPTLFSCVCGGKARIGRGEAGFYVRCEHDPGLASVTEYSSRKRAANAWNKAQEQMDGLSRDAVCAYHARKSYGQYIAGIPVELPPKTPDEVEAPQLRCVCCGLVIPAESTSKKYCSPACAERYREEQLRLRQSSAQGNEIATPVCGLVRNDSSPEDERPRCKWCGVLIPIGSKRLKYCCAECADKALEQMKAEYAKRRKLRGGMR